MSDDRDRTPEDDEAPRPIAVTPGGQSGEQPWGAWGAPPDAATATEEPEQWGPPQSAGEVEIERPGIELALGAVAALLAVAVFLPWYQSPLGKVSGWASGTWGPVVFGLALVAVATVVLRRLKIPVRFPLEHALVLEGIGWVAVILLLVKNFMRPTPFGGQLDIARTTFWIALGAAVGVALLGGMVSKSAPLVLRPGWLREPGGKVGAGLFAGAIAVGAAFGLMNDAGPPKNSIPGVPNAKTYEGMPDCLTNVGVVTPNGITITGGTEVPGGICSATGQTRLATQAVLARYRSGFKAQDWEIVSKNVKQENSQALQVKKGSNCLSVSVLQTGSGTKRKDKAVYVTMFPLALSPCNLEDKVEESRTSPSPSP